MCAHDRCSGMLVLEPPARLIVMAFLCCDVCGVKLAELPRQSAEATVVALLNLPRLAFPA